MFGAKTEFMDILSENVLVVMNQLDERTIAEIGTVSKGIAPLSQQ